MPVDLDQIAKVIELRKQKAVADYPALWQEVIRDWAGNGPENAAWLTYAANYLFRTGGVHWAMDPFFMGSRIQGIAEPNFQSDLAKLELVALTHAHSDHLDLRLIEALSFLPVQWIIPQHMLPIILEKTSIHMERVIVPENGVKIHYRGLTLTPFDSLHMHRLGGIPETGYLVEFEGQRWLFPADVRDFSAGKLPAFENLDGVFAHLWMGKGHANDERPPFLDDFCDFYASFGARRIVVTHLNEYGRAANELWDCRHHAMVKEYFLSLERGIAIEFSEMGMKVSF